MAAQMEPTRLAVLIDADNANPAIVEGLLAEIRLHGSHNFMSLFA